MQQVGVLADRPEARSRCQLSLEQRPGVDVGPTAATEKGGLDASR